MSVITQRETTLPEVPKVVLVTGPSGAGRSTALKALEDIGFEAIDNMPISLVRPLVSAALDRPLALVLDPRNRDFSVDALLALVEDLASFRHIAFDLVYLDCPVPVLVRRFSETRRRHPISMEGTAQDGVVLEARLLAPVRLRADVLLETETLTPHDLRAQVQALFAKPSAQHMRVHIESFSFKRGIPTGVDLVFDCRFLSNPHWQDELRALDGRDPSVAAFVTEDPRFAEFFSKIRDLIVFMLPECTQEGKSQLIIGFGCTGGQHRSVAIAEKMANALAQAQWQVSKRHRELERIAAQVADAGNA
ncbi:MAG: RNase adapter RapZ [Roseinatronobacter sp.]